jgi:hypothetical protein
MRKTVLWIEDGAMAEVKEFAVKVYNSRKYDLTIALCFSDAIREMQVRSFDAVIVDIRMKAKESEVEIKQFLNIIGDDDYDRLGLLLLLSLFRKAENDFLLPSLKQEIVPERFGILTIEAESEFKKDVPYFEKMEYRQKLADSSSTDLLELIEIILKKILEIEG